MSDIGPFVKAFVSQLVSEPVDPPFTPTDPCRGLIVKSEVYALLFDGGGDDLPLLGLHPPEA